MSHLAATGQIWQDDCYYLNTQGKCERKFELVLAVDSKNGDCITVVFTSTPNGLPETPVCHIGNPRSGYYLGTLGGVFFKPTWVDFNNLKRLDNYDLKIQVNKTKQKILLNQTLSKLHLCAVLRCIMQIQEDIDNRDYRLLGNTIAELNCP